MNTGHRKYRCIPHKLSRLKMSSNIKLTDVVKRFTGDGDEDVAVWLDRLELIAKLQDITNLAQVIPLFLAGPAYDVYTQLSEGDRRDERKLKRRLLTAFGITPAQAYATFKTRTLMPGSRQSPTWRTFAGRQKRSATMATSEPRSNSWCANL